MILAADIGQTAVATLEEIRQFFVVDAQQCEHRGVQVVDVDFVFHCAEAEVIRRANGLAAANAAAGHPDAETVRAMVTALVALQHRCATELAAPHNERAVGSFCTP